MPHRRRIDEALMQNRYQLRAIDMASKRPLADGGHR
jgi:hypothetical protein